MGRGERQAGPAPLSDWTGALDSLPHYTQGIDAVMQTPDQPQQFWVFREDMYVRTELDCDGPGGANGTLAKYSGFQTRLDATMEVRGRYIEIHLDSDSGHADTLVRRPEPLDDWSCLD